MGWTPRPRFDATRNQWTLRWHNSKYYLCAGRGNEQEACRRACSIMGESAEGQSLETVADAIQAALLARPSVWREGLLKTWFAFAALSPLGTLTPVHLDDYRDWLKRKGYTVHVRRGKGLVKLRREYTAQTVRHKINAAYQVLAFANQRGALAKVPKRPKLDRSACTPQHYDADELRETWQQLPPHAKRVLTFILTTGCRPSEAIRLQWEEVKPRRGPFGECVLRRHKTACRTAQARVLVLTAEAAQVLNDIGAKHTGPVFLSSRRRPYKNAGALRSILRRHGLPKPYLLRHTFAQHLLDSGADVLLVSKFLGHHSLHMAQRYVKARATDLHRVAANLASPLSAMPDAEPESKPARPAGSSEARKAPSRDPTAKTSRSGKARRRRA